MKKQEYIPFNRPHMTGKELFYISESHFNGQLSGDGIFTRRCHEWLEKRTNCQKALLTHSCTAALEMTALLLDIKPGDEVIMPSFTFVSTANAIVLRGGVPIFVDIRDDTLNIDEQLIEDAITPRTKAIMAVHYAGVACDMDAIMSIANRHHLYVVEDAAQGVMASYKDKPLGTIGDLGAFSFHETKNVTSGEGGALLVNNPEMVTKAEIIREKGTDRSRFGRGEVEKYTWQQIGSSYLPGEMVAAFLLAQLEDADRITQKRLKIWDYYHNLLKTLEYEGLLRRPVVPNNCKHNAHMYYLLLSEAIDRNRLLAGLKKQNILAVFHYIPLHSSPAGRRYGKVSGDLKITSKQSDRLIRLPLWIGITEDQQRYIVDTINRLVHH
jgi:dTDP-4-amino-4,6-dideoxygalactose transaminase